MILQKKSYILFSILFIAICAIILFYAFDANKIEKAISKGNTTYSNDIYDCTKSNLDYDYFKTYNAIGNTAKIMLISNNNKIEKISMVLEYNYQDEKDASANLSLMQASMNHSPALAREGNRSVSISYHSNNQLAKMILYADAKDLSDESAKIFMLSKRSIDTSYLLTYYSEIGFRCKNKTND